MCSSLSHVSIILVPSALPGRQCHMVWTWHQGSMLVGLFEGEANSSQKREKDCGLGRPSQISLLFGVFHVPHYFDRILSFFLWSSDFQSLRKWKCVLKASHTFFSFTCDVTELGMYQYLVLKHEIYLLSLPNIITHKK